MNKIGKSSYQMIRGKVWNRANAHLRNRITAGLFVLLPILFTLLILRFAFNFIDGILNPFIEDIFDRSIPGLGIVALIIIIYLVGVLTLSRLGRGVLDRFQQLLLAIPVVRTIFSVGKKIADSMSGESATGLSRVVMIEYPRPGVWSVGFLTGFITIDEDRHFALVYLPTAPLPNSGWIAYVPVEDVYDTDLTVGQTMETVLSSGLEYPENINLRRIPAPNTVHENMEDR